MRGRGAWLAGLALLAALALACGGDDAPAPVVAPAETATPTATSAAVSATAEVEAPAPTVTATSTAMAMPTPTPTPISFPYSLHTTTAVTAPGSYAFLSDATDLQSRSAPRPSTDSEALLVHQSDADGVSRAAFYEKVVAGDAFDWVQGEGECYTRFTVTQVLPDPTGSPARKLFAIEYRVDSLTGCTESQLMDESQPVEFRWKPLPWRMGLDGIRIMLPHEPITGPGRYRLHLGSEVVIQIPEGMTVKVVGAGHSGGQFYSAVVDVESGSKLYFNDDTGEVEGRRFPAGFSGTDETGRDVNALFDQIAASVETPGWGGEDATPATVTPTATAAPCTQETLGVDPSANVGLANDCTTLLAAKATLAGTASLNWSAGTVLTDWDGVTVSGAPKRVTGLSLASRGLTGTIPPALGALTELRELRLDGNSLTDVIPSKLDQLTKLTHVYLTWNDLRGCIPPALDAAAYKDVHALGLAVCRPATVVNSSLLGPGTYNFVHPGSRFTFDIPVGLTVRLGEWVTTGGNADFYRSFESTETDALLVLTNEGEFYYMYVDDTFINELRPPAHPGRSPENVIVRELLEKIARSVRKPGD